jgi:hypothetical protein
VGVTASGLYVANIIDVLDATQLAIDLSLTTNKVALFTNSVTPNFDSDVGYGAAPYNANEVSGTGYTAGGAAVASPTLTGSSGTMTFDMADTSWSSSTITGAHAALVYANALAGKNAIVLVNLGADYSTVNGTFQITWSGSGVFTIDLTP